MESPKTGIAILALLATVTMLGAGLGWQLRLQQHIPETKIAPPVDHSAASSAAENAGPPAATNASLPAR